MVFSWVCDNNVIIISEIQQSISDKEKIHGVHTLNTLEYEKKY